LISVRSGVRVAPDPPWLDKAFSPLIVANSESLRRIGTNSKKYNDIELLRCSTPLVAGTER
ncbi:MAG: hypothetical protein ACK56I_33675, partial [bacterium]